VRILAHQWKEVAKNIARSKLQQVIFLENIVDFYEFVKSSLFVFSYTSSFAYF
jgi:hypothetical protein